MDDRKKNLKDNATFWDERSKIFDTQVMQIYDRAYDKTIQRALRFLEPEDVILDLGCGTGRTTIPISKKVKKVYAIDTSKDMLEKGVKKAAAENCENITFAHTDLMHAKLKPGSLDAVLVFNVLLYFKNQDEVLKKDSQAAETGRYVYFCHRLSGKKLVKRCGEQIYQKQDRKDAVCGIPDACGTDEKGGEKRIFSIGSGKSSQKSAEYLFGGTKN